MPRVIGYAVVYDDKLAPLPLIDRGVLLHEGLEFCDEISRDGGTISKLNCLPLSVPLVHPSRVGRNDLVIEGLSPVSAHSNYRKHLRYDLAVEGAILNLDPLVLVV